MNFIREFIEIIEKLLIKIVIGQSVVEKYEWPECGLKVLVIV